MMNEDMMLSLLWMVDEFGLPVVSRESRARDSGLGTTIINHQYTQELLLTQIKISMARRLGIVKYPELIA